MKKKFEISPTGCWEWTSTMGNKGYGEIRINGKKRSAHRVVYQALKGRLYPGREIDHLCRNRKCVNPDHLESVTRQINQLRGNSVSGINSRKTHCVNGHQFNSGNTYRWRYFCNGNPRISRKCRKCSAIALRKLRNRKKEKENARREPVVKVP